MPDPTLFILYGFLCVPVGLLAHELGHAAMSLILSRQSVELRVGRQDRALRLRIGRLRMSVSPLGRDGLSLLGGLAGPGRWRLLAITLGGPAASLVLIAAALAPGIAAGARPAPIPLTLALVAATQLYASLLPSLHLVPPGGCPLASDGLEALLLITGRELPAGMQREVLHRRAPAPAAGAGLVLLVGAALVALMPSLYVFALAGAALHGVLLTGATGTPPQVTAPAVRLRIK